MATAAAVPEIVDELESIMSKLAAFAAVVNREDGLSDDENDSGSRAAAAAVAAEDNEGVSAAEAGILVLPLATSALVRPILKRENPSVSDGEPEGAVRSRPATVRFAVAAAIVPPGNLGESEEAASEQPNARNKPMLAKPDDDAGVACSVAVFDRLQSAAAVGHMRQAAPAAEIVAYAPVGAGAADGSSNSGATSSSQCQQPADRLQASGSRRSRRSARCALRAAAPAATEVSGAASAVFASGLLEVPQQSAHYAVPSTRSSAPPARSSKKQHVVADASLPKDSLSSARPPMPAFHSASEESPDAALMRTSGNKEIDTPLAVRVVASSTSVPSAVSVGIAVLSHAVAAASNAAAIGLPEDRIARLLARTRLLGRPSEAVADADNAAVEGADGEEDSGSESDELDLGASSMGASASAGIVAQQPQGRAAVVQYGGAHSGSVSRSSFMSKLLLIRVRNRPPSPASGNSSAVASPAPFVKNAADASAEVDAELAPGKNCLASISSQALSLPFANEYEAADASNQVSGINSASAVNSAAEWESEGAEIEEGLLPQQAPQLGTKIVDIGLDGMHSSPAKADNVADIDSSESRPVADSSVGENRAPFCVPNPHMATSLNSLHPSPTAGVDALRGSALLLHGCDRARASGSDAVNESSEVGGSSSSAAIFIPAGGGVEVGLSAIVDEASAVEADPAASNNPRLAEPAVLPIVAVASIDYDALGVAAVGSAASKHAGTELLEPVSSALVSSIKSSAHASPLSAPKRRGSSPLILSRQQHSPLRGSSTENARIFAQPANDASSSASNSLKPHQMQLQPQKLSRNRTKAPLLVINTVQANADNSAGGSMCEIKLGSITSCPESSSAAVPPGESALAIAANMKTAGTTAADGTKSSRVANVNQLPESTVAALGMSFVDTASEVPLAAAATSAPPRTLTALSPRAANIHGGSFGRATLNGSKNVMSSPTPLPPETKISAATVVVDQVPYNRAKDPHAQIPLGTTPPYQKSPTPLQQSRINASAVPTETKAKTSIIPAVSSSLIGAVVAARGDIVTVVPPSRAVAGRGGHTTALAGTAVAGTAVAVAAAGHGDRLNIPPPHPPTAAAAASIVAAASQRLQGQTGTLESPSLAWRGQDDLGCPDSVHPAVRGAAGPEPCSEPASFFSVASSHMGSSSSSARVASIHSSMRGIAGNSAGNCSDSVAASEGGGASVDALPPLSQQRQPLQHNHMQSVFFADRGGREHAGDRRPHRRPHHRGRHGRSRSRRHRDDDRGRDRTSSEDSGSGSSYSSFSSRKSRDEEDRRRSGRRRTRRSRDDGGRQRRQSRVAPAPPLQQQQQLPPPQQQMIPPLPMPQIVIATNGGFGGYPFMMPYPHPHMQQPAQPPHSHPQQQQPAPSLVPMPFSSAQQQFLPYGNQVYGVPMPPPPPRQQPEQQQLWQARAAQPLGNSSSSQPGEAAGTVVIEESRQPAESFLPELVAVAGLQRSAREPRLEMIDGGHSVTAVDRPTVPALTVSASAAAAQVHALRVTHAASSRRNLLSPDAEAAAASAASVRSEGTDAWIARTLRPSKPAAAAAAVAGAPWAASVATSAVAAHAVAPEGGPSTVADAVAAEASAGPDANDFYDDRGDDEGGGGGAGGGGGEEPSPTDEDAARSPTLPEAAAAQGEEVESEAAAAAVAAALLRRRRAGSPATPPPSTHQPPPLRDHACVPLLSPGPAELDAWYRRRPAEREVLRSMYAAGLQRFHEAQAEAVVAVAPQPMQQPTSGGGVHSHGACYWLQRPAPTFVLDDVSSVATSELDREEAEEERNDGAGSAEEEDDGAEFVGEGGGIVGVGEEEGGEGGALVPPPLSKRRRLTESRIGETAGWAGGALCPVLARLGGALGGAGAGGMRPPALQLVLPPTAAAAAAAGGLSLEPEVVARALLRLARAQDATAGETSLTDAAVLARAGAMGGGGHALVVALVAAAVSAAADAGSIPHALLQQEGDGPHELEPQDRAQQLAQRLRFQPRHPVIVQNQEDARYAAALLRLRPRWRRVEEGAEVEGGVALLPRRVPRGADVTDEELAASTAAGRLPPAHLPACRFALSLAALQLRMGVAAAPDGAGSSSTPRAAEEVEGCTRHRVWALQPATLGGRLGLAPCNAAAAAAAAAAASAGVDPSAPVINEAAAAVGVDPSAAPPTATATANDDRGVNVSGRKRKRNATTKAAAARSAKPPSARQPCATAVNRSREASRVSRRRPAGAVPRAASAGRSLGPYARPKM